MLLSARGQVAGAFGRRGVWVGMYWPGGGRGYGCGIFELPGQLQNAPGPNNNLDHNPNDVQLQINAAPDAQVSIFKGSMSREKNVDCHYIAQSPCSR
jgi:hypothetical protein